MMSIQFLTTVPLAAFQFPFLYTVQTTIFGKTAEEIKHKIRTQLINNNSNNAICVNRFLSREWLYLRNKFPLVRLLCLASQHKFHPPYEAAMQQLGVFFLKMFFKDFHISRISLKSFFPSLERARQLERKKPKKDYYGPFYGLAFSRYARENWSERDKTDWLRKWHNKFKANQNAEGKKANQVTHSR